MVLLTQHLALELSHHIIQRAPGGAPVRGKVPFVGLMSDLLPTHVYYCRTLAQV